MADQIPVSTPDVLSSDTDPLAGGPVVVQLVRHDTTSSIGSAKPIPKGHWKLNLSGNCPGCHHHHNSIKIHVRASSDSNHGGDVYCDNCQRLWLGFGNRNSTRLSLLSMKSTEPEPLERVFHSTLVHMIRSATTVAALSPTLADIPESSSTGPSRETSFRSVPRRSVRYASQPVANNVSTDPAKPLNTTTYVKDPESHASGNPLLGLRNRIAEKLPMLRTSRLGRWMRILSEENLSPRRREKLPVHEPQISPNIPALRVDTDPSVQAQVQTHPVTEPKHDKVDVCTPSTTAAEALESLRTLDLEEIRAMTPEQRIDWMRGQRTAFKRYAKPLHPPTIPMMTNTGVQVDTTELQSGPLAPPTRRHSVLAFVGNSFGSLQYWDVFRSSNATLNARPLSMSDTHLSEADTVVEGTGVTPPPRHVVVESLQWDRRGSGSPRPRSLQGMQSWQQTQQNRVEARRSFDSVVTGGAVRSITTTRGRASNRLSRASMGRPSTIYVTEPSMSQVQLPLPTHEDLEQHRNLEHHRSPPPSPPILG